VLPCALQLHSGAKSMFCEIGLIVSMACIFRLSVTFSTVPWPVRAPRQVQQRPACIDFSDTDRATTASTALPTADENALVQWNLALLRPFVQRHDRSTCSGAEAMCSQNGHVLKIRHAHFKGCQKAPCSKIEFLQAASLLVRDQDATSMHHRVNRAHSNTVMRGRRAHKP